MGNFSFAIEVLLLVAFVLLPRQPAALGVDGFDVHYGLTTPNLLESQVNRVMVEIARRRIAVCDSSKFRRRSLSLIVPTSAMHAIITDHGAPSSDLSVLKKSGIDVKLV